MVTEVVGQVLHDGQRLRIGPVQVLQEQKASTAAAHGAEHAGQRLGDDQLAGLTHLLTLGEQGPQGAVVRPSGCLLSRRVQQGRLERLDEGPVGRGRRPIDGPPPQDGQPGGGCHGPGLAGEPGLAHARLTQDEDQPARP